jgi:dTDP-4-dehydrorhamnose reductase
MAGASPILLVSPDGMLGHAFELLLKECGLAYTGVSWPAFDLTKPETVEPWLQDGVTSVINCSAYTDVDGAETHEAEATAINGAGVGLLAAHCRRLGAALVHFSTDYVFDGRATSPYTVDHPISPVNAYGRSKAAGEQAIRDSGCEHLIVRTSWLYAPWAKNFVLTMLGLGREKESLRVVSDQVGRPTSAQYLARRSLELLECGARGTFHVTDGGSCSWHELASMVIEASGSTCRVDPCTSEEFVRPAKRPPYSILDLSKTEALLGPSTDWRENVAAVLAEHAARK